MSSSEMFDWNDEEFADIVWGETGECNDHIVPYTKGSVENPFVAFGDHNKYQWNLEAGTVKPAEPKTSGSKNEVPGHKLESDSYFETNEGRSAPGFDLDLDPLPDSSIQSTSDGNVYSGRNGQDSMDTAISSDLTEMNDFDSGKAYTSCIDNNPQSFWSEDKDKENGDFPDYAWANIGSFDDLDRIFGNEDPVFTSQSLGNIDELWISSADAEKSFPLSACSPTSGLGAVMNASVHNETRKEVMPYVNCLQNVHQSEQGVAEEKCGSYVKPLVEFAEGKLKPSLEKKVGRQIKGLKEDKSKNRNLTAPTGNQIQQFGNQFTTTSMQTFDPSVLSPRGHFGEPESCIYMTNSHPYLPMGYGFPTCHYPVTPLLSHPPFEKNKNHQILSNSKPSKRSRDVPTQSPTLTPQEKIGKLRQRQQMQAMIAVQKQQKQFRDHIISTDHSITPKCREEDQNQNTVRSNDELEENLKIPPVFNPNSPIKQDDSSLEETVLRQLQEVIPKLDIRIRNCIRDSLLRLAESARKRHYGGDTSSTNRCIVDENEDNGKEEANNQSRYTRMPDAETETNPIDRTVAHLLFHKPSESFAGIGESESDILTSPGFTKIPCIAKTEDSMDLDGGCLSTCPKPPSSLVETQHRDPFQSSSCIDNPRNTSNVEQDGIKEAEASK